jgi:hypothetical protein
MTPDEEVAEWMRLRRMSPEERFAEEMEAARVEQWARITIDAAKAAREASTKK